jgi:hypothetical protein
MTKARGSAKATIEKDILRWTMAFMLRKINFEHDLDDESLPANDGLKKESCQRLL